MTLAQLLCRMPGHDRPFKAFADAGCGAKTCTKCGADLRFEPPPVIVAMAEKSA